MKKLFIIALIFLLLPYNTLNVQAEEKKVTSSRIHYSLVDFIDRKLPNQKLRQKLLMLTDFQNIILTRLPSEGFKEYSKNEFLSEFQLSEVINNVEFKDGNLYISYNRFASLFPEAKQEVKRMIRVAVVRELLYYYPGIVSKELQRFDLDIDKDGQLIVNIKPADKITEDVHSKKNLNMDEYIDQALDANSTYNNIVYISEDNHINAYYNYLLGKSDMGTMVFGIDDLLQSIIFRNPQDVKDLLAVNSYRYREAFGTDIGYRQYNISKVYETFSNNYALMPNEVLSYDKLYLQGDDGTKYKYGAAIVNNKEKKIYGGGVCGGATGIYQGAITNGNLDISARNHSWWDTRSYAANIDGQFIKTPGLDSAYFNENLDLRIKNTSNYPIFIISVIDKNKVEKNFTLSFKWAVKKVGVNFIQRKGNCFYWERGGETIQSCYKKGV